MGPDGPWLVQMPSAPGYPESMFGAPIVVDNAMPASGSAQVEIDYGSFERQYLVHMAGLRVESSYHRYFEFDQTAFRALLRVDGKVQDKAAVGFYQRTS